MGNLSVCYFKILVPKVSPKPQIDLFLGYVSAMMHTTFEGLVKIWNKLIQNIYTM